MSTTLKLQLEATEKVLLKVAEAFRYHPQAVLTREEVASTLEMLAAEIMRALPKND